MLRLDGSSAPPGEETKWLCRRGRDGGWGASAVWASAPGVTRELHSSRFTPPSPSAGSYRLNVLVRETLVLDTCAVIELERKQDASARRKCRRVCCQQEQQEWTYRTYRTYRTCGSCRDTCWSLALTDWREEGEPDPDSRLHSGLVVKGAAMLLISFANKLKCCFFYFKHICLVKNCETVFKTHQTWFLNQKWICSFAKIPMGFKARDFFFMCVLPAFKSIVACVGPGGPEDPRDVGAATVSWSEAAGLSACSRCSRWNKLSRVCR